MGKIKGVGTDCGQILIEVYGNVGFIDKFDSGYYPVDFNLHNGEENYFKFVEQYAHQVDEPKDGDIILYKFGRCISHSGIIVNAKEKQIVHALIGVGVTLAQWDEGTLENRIVGFWSVIK
jgi:hypothetical protein